LRNRLTEALFDFKKEKILRQNARLSLVQSLYNTSATKRRLVLMNSNSQNYKPPLERSKYVIKYFNFFFKMANLNIKLFSLFRSAPKLSCIEEFEEEDEDEENFNDSEMTIPECELEDVPESCIQEEEEGSCLPYANGEARVNPEEESTKVEDPLTPPKSPKSHRKSYSHPPTQVIHNPEGGSRRPHTVPMDAKLNLPYMFGYDKVMQLLDMPARDTHQLLLEEDEDEFSYNGQNSDPVASDGSESVVDSNCEDEYAKVIRRRNSSERKGGDEDRGDAKL
jgi:hypothetical protein